MAPYRFLAAGQLVFTGLVIPALHPGLLAALVLAVDLRLSMGAGHWLQAT